MTKPLAISEIREQLKSDNIDTKVLELLRSDERKGVQQLIVSYEKRQAKLALKIKHFKEMWLYEEDKFAQGFNLVAGIDEVGRGPLAGPVVASAVILPKTFNVLDVNDSKQLSESKRS